MLAYLFSFVLFSYVRLINEFLQCCSDGLVKGGALVLVPSVDDISKFHMFFEHCGHALKFKSDGPSFLHYYIYNTSSNSRLKTQAESNPPY